jgi:hypothetical protein
VAPRELRGAKYQNCDIRSKETVIMANQYSIRHSLIHLFMGMLLLPALGWTLVANAQESTYDASFSSATKEGIPINVLVGQSRVINFDRPIGRF